MNRTSATLQRLEAAKILIVGNRGGTSVGMSFVRSARRLGMAVSDVDAAAAQSRIKTINRLFWHLADRRPAKLRSFGQRLLREMSRNRPQFLLTTGLSPLTRETVRAARGQGVACLHYSTDDPWNPRQRAEWHLRTLSEYNIVFTPRRSNIADLRALGCAEVRYLPFAFDDELFGGSVKEEEGHELSVLFVGGADPDRVQLVNALVARNVPMYLVGGYWQEYPQLRRRALGLKTPSELVALTQQAKVNLCLVRRSNRDGHVMRTFEIAALGGCMVVEDTEEHREIFGQEWECVAYFSSPDEAALKIHQLLGDQAERARLSCAVRERIVIQGANTYTDRLRTMIAAAQEKDAP